MCLYKIKDELKDLRLIDKINLMALLLGFFSLFFTLWLASPVELEISENIDVDAGRLNITVKNIDWIRSTGNIYLYRLEVSGDKPHIVLPDLKQRKINKFELNINVKEEPISAFRQVDEFGESCTVPFGKLYFVTEKTSISYKISCDSCSAQGLIRRIPDFGAVKGINTLTSDNYCNYSIPAYSWTEFYLEDVR
ncbi:hypothetical protein J4429_05370 [Candidatus Pacearchaeota archaeon]|nr:hypothetical protein [Candidatus Pacearchaeota archaeon]